MRLSKIAVLIFFVFLALTSVGSSILSLAPGKAAAYTSPTEESVENQLQRTLLYAFGACLSVENLKISVSDDEINKHQIFLGSDQIAVGHEITANHDDNDGAVTCNNDLLYDKGLAYVGKTWADIRDMLYEAREGRWYQKSDGKDAVDKMLQGLREPKRYSKDKAYGPAERKRRLAVAVSRCIKPVPDGNVAADAVEIGGKKYTKTNSDNARIGVGHDMQPDGTYLCKTLIDLARSENVLDGVDVAALINNSASLALQDDTAKKVDGGGTGAGTASGADADNSCEGNSGVLGWIFCPVIKVVAEAIDQYEGYIKDQLITGAVDDKVQTAWSRVRNIALILLVPIMLVMVISTALGFDFIDAYTVKRTLPRLAIAVILISISFELCKFAIEIINSIGNGIQGIMLFPWGASGKNLSNYVGGVAAAVVTTGGIGALTLGWGVLFPVILSAAIGIFLGFVVLTLRQILILLLVITAPIAIIAWILPGTEKFWKLWSNNFSRLLFMFPLIMALLAAGRIGAEIVAVNHTRDEKLTAFGFLLTIIAYVGPFFLIPATFKMGGAMFGALAGATMSAASGFRKNLRGRSMTALQQRGQDLRNENYFRGRTTGMRGALNRRLGGVATGSRGGFGFGTRGEQAQKGTLEQATRAQMQTEEWKNQMYNDAALRALTYTSAQEARNNGVSEEAIAAARLMAGRNGWSQATAIAASQQLAMNKTGYVDAADAAETAARVARGNATLEASTRENIKFASKQVGRNDLGALRERRAGETRQQWSDTMTTDGFEGIDPYSIGREHKNSYKNMADAHARQYADAVRAYSAEGGQTTMNREAVIAARTNIEETIKNASSATGVNAAEAFGLADVIGGADERLREVERLVDPEATDTFSPILGERTGLPRQGAVQGQIGSGGMARAMDETTRRLRDRDGSV